MANIPIKVLLDKDRSPFIPFSTTSSIVENGTNRRLDKILGNLDDLQTNNKNSLVSAINEVLVGSGSGAGIDIQIVDELPTENISLTTIYFKHMTTGKAHNVYEEWMYINDAWELIGTTEMDLSGYATTTMIGDLSTLKTTDKDSIVDAVNELVDKQLVAGDGIELDGNVIKSVSDVPIYRIKVSEYMYDDTFISIDQQDILKIEDKINKAYKSGLDSIGFIVSSIYNDEQYLLINNTNSIQNKYSYYWLHSIESIHNRYIPTSGDNPYTLLTTQLMINLSWTEDTCKVTSAKFIKAPLPLLATNNTVQYTPTGDYNPATKKYVDDKVAEGSGSGVDLSNYLAKDNTTEFTPTADYNPSTKKYVDDKFSSVPLIDSYTKTEVDTKLANYLAKDNLTEYTPTSDYHPATKKFVETVVASIDTSGFITDSNISEHLANYITETDLNERLTKVPYIMVPSVIISSDFSSSDYWGDNTLNCSVSSTTDWSAAMQKIAQAILSNNYPKVYMPITVMLQSDNFNKADATYRAQHLIELKPSSLGYFPEKTSPYTYAEGDLINVFNTGIIDLGVYGTLNITFSITYKYSNNTWAYYSSTNNPSAYVYIGRVMPITSLNLTFDNKQIVHSYTEGGKHKHVFSSKVTGCKNLPVNATTKIADLAGTSTLPDALSTKCELFGTTVSNDVTTYTPLGEATVYVYNNEMYIKVPDITTTDYTDVVCTISMAYEE